jgi:hypothetical protein
MQATAKYLAIITLSFCLGAFCWEQFTALKRSSAAQAIYGNLTQIDAAAEQYFLEYEIADQADYHTLMNLYFRSAFNPVLDEEYSQIMVKRTSDFITVYVPALSAWVTRQRR